MRCLFYVLEDQLDVHAPVFDELDLDRDAILMAELDGEARRRPYHKQRLVLIWSAMRHARDALRARGLTVHYLRHSARQNFARFGVPEPMLKILLDKTLPFS